MPEFCFAKLPARNLIAGCRIKSGGPKMNRERFPRSDPEQPMTLEKRLPVFSRTGRSTASRRPRTSTARIRARAGAAYGRSRLGGGSISDASRSRRLHRKPSFRWTTPPESPRTVTFSQHSHERSQAKVGRLLVVLRRKVS